MAKTYSKFNESTDVTIQPEFESKILAYAAKRIKDSGAVVLSDIKDIITFNDPMDGMISLNYLDTLAEDDESSEDDGGYQYIEDAVNDIADYIQKQGYTLDSDSDDPLIFIDDRYDDSDVDIEESSMNESVQWRMTDKPNQWVNSLTKNKEAIDPITIECKELGIALIAAKLTEDDFDYKVMVLFTDTGKHFVKYLPLYWSDLKAAKEKLLQCKNKEEVVNVLSKYLFMRKSDIIERYGDPVNESTMMNEATSFKSSTRYKEFDLLPKGKGWVDPVELTNKDAGFYAIAGTAYDSTDRSNQDEWGVVLYLVPLDKKYEDIVICGSFYDYEESSYYLMDKLAKAKTPQDVARIIKNQEFKDDYGDDETEFIGALTKIYSAKNESTIMMNESATIRPCDPEEAGFDMLDSNNPFDFEPVELENTDLGFYAIAGVVTGVDPDADFDEDDCNIEICVTSSDLDSSDECLVAEYYDMDYKAMDVMKKLANAKTSSELSGILSQEKFVGTEGSVFDFVEMLESLRNMNEYTEVPDGRMTVELDDSDVIEGDTHLLAELTDEVFQAINTVMDELDPDADLSVIEDTEDKLVIEVVSDEDLDDDTFDEVLSELLEDIDLENIVADMTDSVPITDPADEDFGRVVQYINFYEINGDTVTPSGATMEDNLDYIEDEDVINESFNIKTSLTEFLSKLANEFKKEFKSNPDVDGTSFSFDKKSKDKVFIQAISDSVNPGSRALSNYLRFLDENGVEYKTLQEFEYYKGALNCTIYTTIKITDIKDEEIMNESVIELESGRKVHYYVDDLNFKAGVKFLEDESAINKVLKAINPKASVEDYGLDKLPWVTYKTEEGNKVAVFYDSPIMPYKMSLAIGDGKNLSDFVSNSKSILVFNNLKKLDDWNNINIIVRIMNNLAKVTDRASEYKAIKSLLSNYEKQVYNYAKYDESYAMYESYYKDTEDDLSIDQTKISKALKAIDRILTKAGYPLDNLDKVYRFNYPRPGLVEINLINTLNDTYGFMGNKAYDIDSKIEKKLESLNLTYSSKDKYGKEIYTDDDKLVHYMSNELSKYIKTGKVPDREYSRNMVSAVHPKLEDIAKDITNYLESHPKYKKFNLYEYPPVHAGADWIKIKVRTEDIQDGKDILIDTDKYIAKNHKDLYHRVASKSSVNDKKYPFIEYSTAYTPKPGEGTLMWSNYEMRGSSIKDLMNESTDDDRSEAIASYDFNESTKTPKLPTQKELQAIIQKSLMKIGDRSTRVTVHAIDDGFVDIDLTNTPLATDGRDEDYYNEDDIRNSLDYALKELINKFYQPRDLLDVMRVSYNKVGSLTITLELDSEVNESYSMNEATKVTFRYEDEKDWVSPEDFKKIEKFAIKMEDAFERYLRYMRDLGPNDKLKDQFYTEINVENREKIVITTKTKKKVLKRDITAKLDKYGYNPDPSSYIKALPLEEVKATERGVGWGISPIDKSLGVYVYTGFKALAEPDYLTRIMRGEIKPGDPDPNAKATNESTKFDFDNLEEVLEEDLDSAIDLPDYADGILVSCYPTGQGYGVKVTLDERLVGDNKLHIIDRITKVVIDRCGTDYDLDQKRNRSKGEYYLTYSYKGSPFNECTLYPSTPNNTDYNQERKNSLAKAMVTDQPLVDEYDIRCTIRPVFIRKGQYLYDGATVYRTTSDAKLNEESGLYDIKVDVLLSNDDALAEPSTTISYSADFTGLKLLKSNPVKPYNESADPKKVNTVNMSFSNEDDAKDFIKDNGLDPVKSYQGKFGWVVEVKKSELKVK